MKTKTLSILAMLLLAFALTSCQTQEERVINKLENLSERIEKGGNDLTSEDWEDILSEYEAIHEEAMDCDFSQEQLKEFGRVDGQLSAAITKEGAKKLGRDVAKILNGGKDYMEGFIDGLGDVMKSDE